MPASEAVNLTPNGAGWVWGLKEIWLQQTASEHTPNQWAVSGIIRSRHHVTSLQPCFWTHGMCTLTWTHHQVLSNATWNTLAQARDYCVKHTQPPFHCTYQVVCSYRNVIVWSQNQGWNSFLFSVSATQVSPQFISGLYELEFCILMTIVWVLNSSKNCSMNLA